MARLRDLPAAIRGMGFVPFCKKVWFEISDDNLWTWGSALAYSWLFAIFPFFLVPALLIPMLKYEWRLEAKNQINQAINQLPHDAKVTISKYIEPKLDRLMFEKSPAITIIWIVGLGATLWAASGGMAMTMSAMDRCYDVERAAVLPAKTAGDRADPHRRDVHHHRRRADPDRHDGDELPDAGNGATARAGDEDRQAGAIARDAEGYQGANAGDDAGDDAGCRRGRRADGRAAGEICGVDRDLAGPRYGLSLLLIFWVVALVYHFGPNVRQRFRILTPGAVFTVAMWLLLGSAFRVYVDRWGKYGETYVRRSAA